VCSSDLFLEGHHHLDTPRVDAFIDTLVEFLQQPEAFLASLPEPAPKPPYETGDEEAEAASEGAA